MAAKEGTVTVHATVNMSDVKKELDTFFNTTVSEVKTRIDTSELLDKLKEIKNGDFMPKMDFEKVKAALGEIGPGIKQMGTDISQWSMNHMISGLQSATAWVKGLGEEMQKLPEEPIAAANAAAAPVTVPVTLDGAASAAKLESDVSPILGKIGIGVAAVGTGISKWTSFAFSNQLNQAKKSVLDIGAAMGTDLAPVVSGVTEGFRKFSDALVSAAATDGIAGMLEVLPEALNGFLEKLPEFVPQLTEGVTALIGGVAAVLPTILPEILNTAMELLISLVAELPQLMDVALQLITGLADGIITSLPELIKQLPLLIEGIVTFFAESATMLIEVGTTLLTSLVGALPDIISNIVAVLPQIINGIVSALLEQLPLIVQAGIDLLVSLIQNLPEIITTLVAAIPQIVLALVEGIVGNIDKIIMAGVELFVALIQNLPTIIVEIVKAVPQIIGGLVSAFVGMASKMNEIGMNLIKGIFDGISGSAQWLWSKLKEWCGNILSNIKGFFGIHSPSTVMSDMVGKNLALGMAEGITENSDAVEGAVGDVLDGAIAAADSRDMAVSMNGAVIPATTEAEEPGMLSRIQTMFEEAGRTLPQGFFTIGDVSAGQFGAAFLARLEGIFEEARAKVAAFQQSMTLSITASAEQAVAKANQIVNNNGATFHNSYTIMTASASPKATADAIKNQMTMQRMLFA